MLFVCQLLRSKIEAAEAERLEREAEAKRKEDAEKALETIVYEDKPIVPRERNSVTASATFEEVDALTLHIKRSLVSGSQAGGRCGTDGPHAPRVSVTLPNDSVLLLFSLI